MAIPTAARLGGFPLDRGSVEDGILTCHWHHARFELASGCTFDLWADDVPTCSELVARIVDEAAEILGSLAKQVAV